MTWKEQFTMQNQKPPADPPSFIFNIFPNLKKKIILKRSSWMDPYENVHIVTMNAPAPFLKYTTYYTQLLK